MLEFIRLLEKGGPVMVPLMVCSLVSLAVIIERAIVFRRAGAGTESLMAAVRQRYRRDDGAEALAACERAPGPVAAVLASGLREVNHNGHMADAMEEQALVELPHLTRRLVVLDTIITIAPLLGLLGTVWGMINSFHVLARSGVSRPSGITAGIAEALIATATGLVIAIFTLVAYNYFQDKVKQITGEIEMRSTQLTNLISRHHEEPAGAPQAERV
jgi:biopolymer transport protein ExbB